MRHRHHIPSQDQDLQCCGVCGFTLLESLISMAILAITCSSVLVVMDRCMKGTRDVSQRLQAFEVARDNMEQLLTATKVSEYSDFGMSDKYPSIEWQNNVELFDEPIMGEMWVRAVCSATFQDDNGESQKVELIHWLNHLTDAQQKALEQTTDEESIPSAEDQVIDTIEDAVAYAGVDRDTIEQWLDNGMLQAQDGTFIKHNLDIFMKVNGNPTDAQKSDQILSVEDHGSSYTQEQEDTSPAVVEKETEEPGHR